MIYCNQLLYFILTGFSIKNLLYRIKWVGYPSSENTWEKADLLWEDVPQMVTEYEQNFLYEQSIRPVSEHHCTNKSSINKPRSPSFISRK